MADHDNRMTELARGFPCLRQASGVDPWNAVTLDRWATGPVAHGEQVTARFLLAVWDPGHEWASGQFDAMEALRLWDERHREAFLEWASDPWWP